MFTYKKFFFLLVKFDDIMIKGVARNINKMFIFFYPENILYPISIDENDY